MNLRNVAVVVAWESFESSVFKREAVASKARNLIPPPLEYVGPKAQYHNLP
jgi:hypothetical protein